MSRSFAGLLLWTTLAQAQFSGLAGPGATITPPPKPLECTPVQLEKGSAPSIWGQRIAFETPYPSQTIHILEAGRDQEFGTPDDYTWPPFAYNRGLDYAPQLWDDTLFYLHYDNLSAKREVRMVSMDPRAPLYGLPVTLDVAPFPNFIVSLEVKQWPHSEPVVSWVNNRQEITWCKLSDCRQRVTQTYRPANSWGVINAVVDPTTLLYSTEPAFVWTEDGGNWNYDIGVRDAYSEYRWANSSLEEIVYDVASPYAVYKDEDDAVHLGSHWSQVASPIVSTRPGVGETDERPVITKRPVANDLFLIAWVRETSFWAYLGSEVYFYVHSLRSNFPYREVRIKMSSRWANCSEIDVDEANIVFSDSNSGYLYFSQCYIQ